MLMSLTATFFTVAQSVRLLPTKQRTMVLYRRVCYEHICICSRVYPFLNTILYMTMKNVANGQICRITIVSLFNKNFDLHDWSQQIYLQCFRLLFTQSSIECSRCASCVKLACFS